MTSQQLATNYRSAYGKLSRIVHAAENAYRTLHVKAMFVKILLQVPRPMDCEKDCVEILSEFVI